MYWGDVFTSPLFFINFPAYKNYTLTFKKYRDKEKSQLKGKSKLAGAYHFTYLFRNAIPSITPRV